MEMGTPGHKTVLSSEQGMADQTFRMAGRREQTPRKRNGVRVGDIHRLVALSQGQDAYFILASCFGV